MADRVTCGQCGSSLPEAANYCPECGAPHALKVLDPLSVAVTSGPVEPTSPSGSRVGTLVGLMLLAGVMVLIWVLAREAEQPAGEAGDETPVEEIGLPESTTAVMESSSTSAPATTTSSATSSTTTIPEPVYVNDTPGPVLDEGVEGTLIGVTGSRIHRIDLATGELVTIELDRSVEFNGPDRGVVVGDDFVAGSGGAVIVTDLTTGAQRELLPSREQSDEPYWPWYEVVGRAGPESVWVVTQVPEPGGSPEAIEVALGGSISKRIDLPTGFWVHAAGGRELILEGPAGWWTYDTTTGTAVELTGEPVGVPASMFVTYSCDPTLACEVLVDRGSGSAAMPVLTLSDFTNSEINFAPDLSRALVYAYDWIESRLQLVDFVTGVRTDLGTTRLEPWLGTVWVPDTPWVIGATGWGGPPEWSAVNTETAEEKGIELPGRLAGSQDPAHLFILPVSGE